MRLFLALWPDAGARDALRAHQQAWDWPPGAALVPAERLHLTLHFLGAVDAQRLDTLERSLAVPLEPFALSLAGARAHLWAGGLAVLEFEAPAALHRLYGSLGAAVRASGLPVEARAFRPHLTLARKAAGARPPPVDLHVQWPVGSYALVRSVPGRGYETLRSYGPA